MGQGLGILTETLGHIAGLLQWKSSSEVAGGRTFTCPQGEPTTLKGNGRRAGSAQPLSLSGEEAMSYLGCTGGDSCRPECRKRPPGRAPSCEQRFTPVRLRFALATWLSHGPAWEPVTSGPPGDADPPQTSSLRCWIHSSRTGAEQLASLIFTPSSSDSPPPWREDDIRTQGKTSDGESCRLPQKKPQELLPGPSASGPS